jgi:hypothetical protein
MAVATFPLDRRRDRDRREARSRTSAVDFFDVRGASWFFPGSTGNARMHRSTRCTSVEARQ